MRTPFLSGEAAELVDDRSYAWSFTQLMTPRSSVRYQDVHSGGYTRTKNSNDPLSPATPWAMHLADDAGMYRWLVLDLDAKGDPERKKQVERDAEVLCEQFSGLGITAVVCESSSSGGLHIWLAPSEPVSPKLALQFARVSRSIAPSVDIVPLANPATGAVRPPFSPHPDGSCSRPRTDPTILMRHITSVAQINAFIARHYTATLDPLFTLEDGAPSHEVKDAHGHPYIQGVKRELPSEIAALLRHGHPTNPSSGMWSILLSAVHSHWTYRDVYAQIDSPGLLSARTRSGGAGVRRVRRDAASFLARQWARAVRFVATSTTRGRTTSTMVPLRKDVIDAHINRQFQVIADDEWFSYRDEHGAAALRVYAALCVLTQQAARFDIGADVRRLAEMTGMSRATVARALQGLKARGYIFLISSHYGTYANVWSIRENTSVERPVGNCETQGCTPAPVGGLVLSALTVTTWLKGSTHDAFWKNPNAANAYGWVVLDRSSYEDFQKCWGSQFVGRSLDDIACMRGTTGILMVQAWAHEAERVVWSWWCHEVDFLRQRSERIFHHERQEWYAGKRPMVRGRFPRVGRVPDFSAALGMVHRQLGSF